MACAKRYRTSDRETENPSCFLPYELVIAATIALCSALIRLSDTNEPMSRRRIADSYGSGCVTDKYVTHAANSPRLTDDKRVVMR